MFDIGFSEVLLIFVIALIVLGPEKLPRAASQVGRWVGRARAMARQFKEQLEEEVNLENVRKAHKETAAKEEAAGKTTASSDGTVSSAAGVAGGRGGGCHSGGRRAGERAAARRDAGGRWLLRPGPGGLPRRHLFARASDERVRRESTHREWSAAGRARAARSERVGINRALGGCIIARTDFGDRRATAA